MSLPFRRRGRPKGAARLALAGDFPDPDQTVTEMLQAAGPADWDGTTIEFTGASIIGLPAGVTAFAVKQAGRDTEPLARYQPAPASFPALPAAPGPQPAPVLAPVEITEPAVIGDELRLPVIWCEMPGCISWFHHPGSAGFADSSSRAMDAGWCEDALGRLACPDCQQTRADYRSSQPVAWHHPDVARYWHEHGRTFGEEDAFRLGVEAELGRRVSYEQPALARAIAGATHRTAAS